MHSALRSQRGRPRSLDLSKRQIFFHKLLNPLRSDREIQTDLGISRATFYRLVQEHHVPTITVAMDNPWPDVLRSQVFGQKVFCPTYEYEVAVIRMLSLLLKCRFEIKLTAMGKIFDGLEDGKFQCAISSLCDTPERRLRANFSPHYHRDIGSNNVYIFGPKKLEIHKDPKDLLRGRTVGVILGTVHDTYLEKNFADLCLVRRFLYQGAKFDALRSGRVDLVISHADDTLTFIHDMPEVIVPLHHIPYGVCTGAAIAKGQDEIGEKISRAMEQLVSSGFVGRLSEYVFDHHQYMNDFSPFYRPLNIQL
jgi:arginine/ornithine transport system substrate-binding protein